MSAAAARLPVAERLAYRFAQSVRVAWYGAHYAAARARTGRRDGEAADSSETRSGPERPAFDVPAARRALQAVFDADLAHIAEGLYPAPRDLDPGKLARAFGASRRYFEDLPKIAERRQAPKGGVEVRDGAREAGARYPTYYLQNFHFQTDGWLSRRSAQLYDTQVEVLFTGAADAMRRMALAEVARAIRGRDQRAVSLLDVACGTGRFLEQTLDAFPRLGATGLDLSDAYLEEGAGRLAPWPQARLVEGNVEAMPIETGSQDVTVSIYLFHELPPRVRPAAAAEIARVTKPGGTVVIADSIQYGDDPNLDRLLDAFPQEFHEPYYKSWCEADARALFTDAGLQPQGERIAFLTKVMTFERA